MKIKELISILKNSVLLNLAIAQDDIIIRQFIYLGVSDLYKKFGLAILSTNIPTTPNKNLYVIEDARLNILINVYDGQNNKFESNDVSDCVADFKKLNYNSFILSKPKEGFVTCVYLGSPKPIESDEDELQIPLCMLSALMNFVGYMANSTIVNTQVTDTLNPSNTFLQAYTLACNELEAMGYKIAINTESPSVQQKGFV